MHMLQHACAPYLLFHGSVQLHQRVCGSHVAVT
jgi:hypothetical protein